MANHILSVLVENQAGALSKVTGLFSRRGFNIESLAVGITEKPEISRITIVVDGDERTVDQVCKQLAKLICVLTVMALDSENSISRELVLIKVNAQKARRAEIIQIVDIFRAKIVDVSRNTLTIESTGDNVKIIALLDLLNEFGVLEVARTGMVSLERGSDTINKQVERN